jgi:hypothetical protein
VLQRGFWAAFSIYPSTKMGNARMVELLKKYGAERVIVDSACELACYANALAAYGQSGQMQESDWLDPPPIDQRTLYEGNSVLRGGREPRLEEPKSRRGLEELIIE